MKPLNVENPQHDQPTDHAALLARLARAERREAALAGVLRAEAEGGDDLDAVLFEIAAQAAALTRGSLGSVFVVEGDKIAVYGVPPLGNTLRKAYRNHSNVSALTEVIRDRNVLRFDDQSVLGDEYPERGGGRREGNVHGRFQVPADGCFP
jgi:hypothetical protein